MIWRLHAALWAYYALTSAMLSLPMAALTLLMNRELGLSQKPERVSAYYAALFATSLLRPLWGALSDRLPRRALIVPGCALSGGSTLLIGLAHTPGALFGAGMTAAAAFSASESAADGLLVQAAAGDPALVARLQVAAMTVRTAASAVASVLGAALLRVVHPRAVLGLAGALGGVAACASLAIREAGGEGRACSALAAPGVGRVAAVLRSCAPAALLLFLLGCTPSSDDAYASFLAAGLAPPLRAWQLGCASACESCAALGGTLLYGLLARKRPTRALLGAATAAAAAASLLRCAAPGGCLGLAPPLYAALTALLTGAASRAAFMPQLVLSAQLAPRGSEAAGFCALVAVTDAGALAGAGLTAALTASLRVGQPPGRSWAHLPALVACCALTRVLPLLLLPWVRTEAEEEPQAEADADSWLEEAEEPLLPLRED